MICNSHRHITNDSWRAGYEINYSDTSVQEDDSRSEDFLYRRVTNYIKGVNQVNLRSEKCEQHTQFNLNTISD
jgi:hypothetical protein